MKLDHRNWQGRARLLAVLDLVSLGVAACGEKSSKPPQGPALVSVTSTRCSAVGRAIAANERPAAMGYPTGGQPVGLSMLAVMK